MKIKLGIIISILVAITVLVVAKTGLNTSEKLFGTQKASADQGTQSGKAVVTITKATGDWTNGQSVNIGIKSGYLRNLVKTDLLFAKLVIKFDPSVLRITEDPTLLNLHWKEPIYSSTKTEIDQKGDGKIILIAALSADQNPIDYDSRLAKLVFKKKASVAAGTKTKIELLIDKSQIINSPTNEAYITATNLTITF